MKKNILLTGAVLSVAAAAAIFGLMNRSEAADLTNAANTNINKRTMTTSSERVRPTDADIEARRAETEKTRAAIEAAIAANDYDAWVKAVGTSHPWVSKITKDNFSKLVEAHNLRQQADKIMAELGIDKGIGEGQGFGFGLGKGEGRGMGHGLGNGQGLHLGQVITDDAVDTD